MIKMFIQKIHECGRSYTLARISNSHAGVCRQPYRLTFMDRWTINNCCLVACGTNI